MLLRTDLDFALMRPTGRTPNTMAKTWFFDLPSARADDASMTELLHRVFFDANTRLRAREPNDAAYLTLVTFKTAPIDSAAILGWDGKSATPFPWHEAHQKIVWEPGACFIVDAAGRYDTMGALDFTELVLNRLLEEQTVDERGWVAFFDRYIPHPPAGKTMWADRVARLANLTVIRDLPGTKRPGALPIASGPVA